MLFGMVERGMDAEVVGDKGKAKATSGGGKEGEEAMWAIVLTKELWKKGIWYVWVFRSPTFFLNAVEN